MASTSPTNGKLLHLLSKLVRVNTCLTRPQGGGIMIGRVERVVRGEGLVDSEVGVWGSVI